MLSQEELKKVLHYNPTTGVFTWLIRPSNAVYPGDIAGSQEPDGYIRIGIKGIRYTAHNLAWLYMKGHFPEADIDHKDTIRHNNKWNNLREASRSENQCNRRKTKNKLLPKGISKKKHLLSGTIHYTATIKKDGSCSTKSLSVVSGRSDEDVILHLSNWLDSKRKELHKDFYNRG